MNINLKFPKLIIDEKKYKKYPFKTVDRQLAVLPKKIQYCIRCVVSNQRPRTEFDSEGVCNACRWAEKKFGGKVDWDKREKELVKLLNKHRSKDGRLDVIVPGSAGKDSALVAHQLKHKYGMHPIQVTWAPFIYTDIGWQNFQNMIQSGFDGATVWPNGLLHRKLSRVAFELKGDPFEPFVWGQKAMPFQLALRYKIPLIFYGENGEVEYGGSFKNANKPYESPDDWDELYLKGAGVNEIIKKGYEMGILTKEEIKENNFEFYRAPAKKDVKRLGLQMHWWSYYKPWVPQENFYYAAKNTGFEANTKRTDATYSKAFSIDDRLDPFHWLLAFIKFGGGRATREACSDIRCGHITREEAVALVQRYDHEFPKTYFNDFLTYLGITENHFWKIIDQYRQSHIWKKEKGKWKLRTVVSNKSVYGEKPKYEE